MESHLRYAAASFVFSYVPEFLDVRNRWAHEQPFSSADAAHVLDTVRQLAAAIRAPDVAGVSTAPAAQSDTSALTKGLGQRAVMRDIYARFSTSEARFIEEFVLAERSGRVQRKVKQSTHTPEQYEKALLADGLKKGWFK